ncbi:MAG: SUF system Fe-S cluster assembly protein, partial [Erythrobacter sp.]
MTDSNDKREYVAAPAPNEDVIEAPQAPEKPPRARVEDAVDPDAQAAPEKRERDYLEGFLAASPAETPATGAGGDQQAAVVEALREIYDPA